VRKQKWEIGCERGTLFPFSLLSTERNIMSKSAEEILIETKFYLKEMETLFLHLTSGGMPRFNTLNLKLVQVELEIELANETIATLEGEDWIDD